MNLHCLQSFAVAQASQDSKFSSALSGSVLPATTLWHAIPIALAAWADGWGLLQPTSLAMASNLLVMASNLLAMASK